MIPFLGWTGMKEDCGVGTDRGHIGAVAQQRPRKKTTLWLKVSQLNTSSDFLFLILRLKCEWESAREPKVFRFLLNSRVDNKQLQLLAKFHPSLTICTFWMSKVIIILADFIQSETFGMCSLSRAERYKVTKKYLHNEHNVNNCNIRNTLQTLHFIVQYFHHLLP